jgi:hypothetical protein
MALRALKNLPDLTLPARDHSAIRPENYTMDNCRSILPFLVRIIFDNADKNFFIEDKFAKWQIYKNKKKRRDQATEKIY